ncbi:MAG: hypothetical protein AMJ69_07280 [Gammaproteobacteria bacterium SG8_47]|nr:MAG: hypothetical protein AMJ69_07280 [Gammaproteobacteria bacterium SG8_47]
MRGSLLLALCLFVSPAVVAAQPWVFDESIAVTQVQGGKIFHHLESSGRHNIAVSGTTVAVAWEDDRDGTPRIYLARKETRAAGFGDDVRISGNDEAYEPSLAALSAGRFVVAWEEAGQVLARIAGPRTLGPVLRLSQKEGGQPSLVVDGNQIIAVWSERGDGLGRIRLARLHVAEDSGLSAHGSCFVDPPPAQDEQLYPSAAVVDGDAVVVWEDRRLGHTVIMAAVGKSGSQCEFSSPQRISEQPNRAKSPYGKGHGVARATLASYGRSGLLVAWADKRDYRHGYDIYGAHYSGTSSFGPNVRIQDDFGELARQWHASAAGDRAGRVVVAWTDEREGNADVVLSWSENDRWSDDTPVPPASGPGEQSHPSIVLAEQGDLHIVWVERDSKDAPTRLRYAQGRAPAN